MIVEKNAVCDGLKVIEEAQNSFNRIMESAQFLNKQIKGVSIFARDIAGNSHKISTEIQHVTSITQETTAQTEKVAASISEQMNLMQEINNTTEGLLVAAQELQLSAQIFKFN